MRELSAPTIASESQFAECVDAQSRTREDRKSTRLNSSHRCISYAVFCLKKKKHRNINTCQSHQQMKKLRLCTQGTIMPVMTLPPLPPASSTRFTIVKRNQSNYFAHHNHS